MPREEWQRPLEAGVESPRRPRVGAAADAGQEFADADGADPVTRSETVLRPVVNDGRPHMTTRGAVDQRHGGPVDDPGGQVDGERHMSAAGSRRVMNAVRVPGRRDNWVICPSTQIWPEPVDPLRDLDVDRADRPRLVGGVGRHALWSDLRRCGSPSSRTGCGCGPSARSRRGRAGRRHRSTVRIFARSWANVRFVWSKNSAGRGADDFFGGLTAQRPPVPAGTELYSAKRPAAAVSAARRPQAAQRPLGGCLLLPGPSWRVPS